MAATAATSASLFNSSKQIVSTSSTTSATSFLGSPLPKIYPTKRRLVKIIGEVIAASPVAAAPVEEIKQYVLPTWAEFDHGRAPVYWKTMNGLPPTAGERLKLFYNPNASKLVPNEDFGIAFNGGFNQPIMCGGEPRVKLQKVRGKADPPIYTIQICIPKHVPKAWRNRPINFFTEGLAEELSKEGACDRAIFPDTNIVVTRCAMIGNLSLEGGDRCNLDLVPGCTDPSSPWFNPLANVEDGSFNPLANVEDGSCPPYSDFED